MPFPKVRSHQLASGSDEQMFGAKQQVSVRGQSD